jgi:hypothetical protein
VAASGDFGMNELGGKILRVDASGRFSLGGLIAGNTVTLVPSYAGYAFDPPRRVVHLTDVDAPGQDFAAGPPSPQVETKKAPVPEIN